MTGGRIVRLVNPRHKKNKTRAHKSRKHHKATRARRAPRSHAPKRRRRESYSYNPSRRSHRKHNRRHHYKYNPGGGGSLFSTDNLIQMGVGGGIGILAQLGSSAAVKSFTGGEKPTDDQLKTRENVGKYRAWIVAGIFAAIAYVMRKNKYKVVAFSAAFSSGALAIFDALDKKFEFGRGKVGTGLDAVVSMQRLPQTVQRQVGMGTLHSLPNFRQAHGIPERTSRMSNDALRRNYGTAGSN